MEEPSTEPAIAAAIITNGGKVLMVKRRIKEGSLSWQFPAGAIENGETPGQAAIRETHEETGLTVTEAGLLGERVHPNTGRTMHYVACAVVSGDAAVVDDDELSDVEWVTHARLGEHVPHGLFEPVQAYLDTHLGR